MPRGCATHPQGRASIVFYSFPCEMLYQRFPDYEILDAHGPRADFVFIEAHDHIAVLVDVELLVVGNPLEAFVRHFRRRHKVRPLLRVLRHTLVDGIFDGLVSDLLIVRPEDVGQREVLAGSRSNCRKLLRIGACRCFGL
mgnify:CR=1 FL=1